MTDSLKKELLCLELSFIDGIGPRRIAGLYKEFGTIEAIWNADESQLRRILPRKPLQELIKGPDLERAQKLKTEWSAQGIEICTLESLRYPKLLREIYDAPPVLYYMGDVQLLQSEMMAVVGARRCTAYGKRAAEMIGQKLAMRGYAVVSGMAYGIDACGHQGALDVQGKTIAVLANGVDICYPTDHYPLWEQIRTRGLLLSEYAPGVQPQPGFFPQRNRIISGLCSGVVIVEAGEKSGSLITADQALEQGRDVYCVPGSIFSKMSCGVHRLVQQGACLLSDVEDLPGISVQQSEIVPELSDSERAVCDALEDQGSRMQDIIRAVSMPMQELMQTLSMLEMQGIIKQTDEQRWVRLII